MLTAKKWKKIIMISYHFIIKKDNIHTLKRTKKDIKKHENSTSGTM